MGGINRPLNTSPANKKEYEKLIERIESLISDQKKRAFIQKMNAEYFDSHASPDAVGKYIFSSLRKQL